MDKFSTFEHDTLLSFLPFIEQKVATGYRNDINSGTLPKGIHQNPDMESLFIRSVNNFNKNLEAIKKNRPGALTGQQWDDLIFIFSSIENDVMNNPMIQPLFSNSAGKCHQILLAKRAERLVPFREDGQVTSSTLSNDWEGQSRIDAAPSAIDSLQDLKDKAFNRGLIGQVAAFVFVLAYVVVLLVNPRAYWSLVFLLIAAFALLQAIWHLRLAKKIQHQVKLVLLPADGETPANDGSTTLPDVFCDSNARRFCEVVRDPDDYVLPSQPQNYARECLTAGQARAADQLNQPPQSRYLNASLLRFDMLGIGRCMQSSISRNGCQLYLVVCCQALELVRSVFPEKKQQAIAAMIEKTTREVFTIALDQIENLSRTSGRPVGDASHYAHAFDLLLNMHKITHNKAFLRIITDRINKIESRLTGLAPDQKSDNAKTLERIGAYGKIARDLLVD